jgi:predicted nucleic acid-binding protein
MGAFFLDSNAVAKRYVPEKGQMWVQDLCDPAKGHHLYISQLAEIEVVAIISGWLRANTSHGSVTQKQRRRLQQDRDERLAAFKSHCDRTTGTYRVVNVGAGEMQRAADLCHHNNLNSLDAIQLVCALVIQEQGRDARLPGIDFVTSDGNFAKVVKRYGFTVWDPERFADSSEANFLGRAAIADESSEATWSNLWRILGQLVLHRN